MFKPNDKEANRTYVVGVRMSKRERATVKRLAKAAKLSVSDYIRTCIEDQLQSPRGS